MGDDLIDRLGGGHDERVAVVGPEVRHPAVDDDLHDLALATEGRERGTRRRCLGEGHEIRAYAESLARAGVAGGEPSLDLVKDEDDAVLVAGLADAGEIALVGHDDGDVLEHRLHDDRGDLTAVLRENGAETLEIVVGRDMDGAGLDVEGHLGIGRQPDPRRKVGLDGDLEGVISAVIAAPRS